MGQRIDQVWNQHIVKEMCRNTLQMFSVTSGQPFLFQMLSRSFRFLQSRLFATKHRHTRNSFYYDVLKLPSTASQTQIKEAFFKLSKIHHPDVSDSEDSKLQFHLIADAYAILGNVHSRRMYDRGLISEATSAPLAKPEEEEYNPFKLPPKPVKSDLDKEVLQKYQDISVQRRREKQLGVAVKEKEKAKDHDSDNFSHIGYGTLKLKRKREKLSNLESGLTFAFVFLVGVVMFKVGYHGYFFKDIDAKQMGYDKEAQRVSVPKTLY